jgi:ABC-2 type transport system permease protein
MINRIIALLIRYQNIALGSMPRLISIFYWPTVQILFWGFFTNYFYQINEFNIWSSLNVILSAVVLWDVLFRSQLGLSMSFFEELWSRNLPNLFITPIKDYEIILGLLLISFLRTILGLTPAIFFANYFFNFHLFELGLYLIFFFFNLTLIGWSIGLLVSALVLRYGQSFEELAWAIIFIVLPFSCVYYPLSSLPEIMQSFSSIFPTTMIFEEMRSLIFNSHVEYLNVIKIICINMILLLLSSSFFLYTLNVVRKKGIMINQGE